MPSPPIQPATYPSTAFVESAGAVLFRPSTTTSAPQICLLHQKRHNTYVLPKGRRDIHERRQDAAVREVEEETGYKVRLLPINLWSWQTSPNAIDSRLGLRECVGVCEPFMLQQRMFREDQLKVIWWFVSVVDESVPKGKGEPQFEVEWFEFDKAAEVLEFETDREVVEEAIEIYRRTADKSDLKGEGARQELMHV